MENQKSQANPTTFFILSFTISWLLWLAPLLRSNDLAQLPEFTEIFGIDAARVTIFDQEGKIRWGNRKYRKGDLIDVSELKPGVYFVIINLHDRKITLKMVKL